MQSVWSDSAENSIKRANKKLYGDVKTDVLIVGAGMAGMLCAHKLKKSGVACIIAEANQIGSGVTKNTAAKITAQHGLIYADLMKKKGMDGASQYFEVNTRAIQEYRMLSKKIPCDFEVKTAYVYSIDSPLKIEREAEAYKRIGAKLHFEDETPIPFKTVGAVGMENQAQFNPMKFIMGISDGLEIYENSFIYKIENGRAYTKDASVSAKSIILATHFPFVNIPGLYFMKMYQHRSYVIGLKRAPDMDGMYVDEQMDGYSFRNYKDLLLVGGGDHKTGKKGGGYIQIRNLVKESYPESIEEYAWSTQDCMTLDGMPYIGVHRAAAPNLYVATGFNKWGMTGSMVSAMILCDIITKGESEYQTLFSPSRSVLHPQLFLNTLNAAAGYASFGKRCPHMGCALKWNHAECTWDCPCHGSRFEKTGKIIDNPAKKDASV